MTCLGTESSDQRVALRRLAGGFAWPAEKPSAATPGRHVGWLGDGAREVLRDSLDGSTELVVELGAWLGLSTRWIADHAPRATIISIDHWRGSPEHQAHPQWRKMLPTLYESFLAECWSYRERIIPLRMITLEGLKTVGDHALRPDLVYIDAEHSYSAVTAELELIQLLFPDAVVVGDDYDSEVRSAVEEHAARADLKVETTGHAWRAWRLV